MWIENSNYLKIIFGLTNSLLLDYLIALKGDRFFFVEREHSSSKT
jgi:hypothetical protein